MSIQQYVLNCLRQILGKPDLGLVLATLIFVLILVSCPQLALFNVFSDQDPPWLIKTGLWILEHQSLPAYNPFSNGLPELGNIPIVCYQWLFEVFLGIAYKLDGLSGITILVGTVYSLFILSIYYWLHGKKLKPIPTILFLMVFSLGMLKSYALARPVLISCLFTPLLLMILESRASKAGHLKSACSLWVLITLWANLHLGFVTGIMIAAVFLTTQAIGNKTWKPIAVLAGCFIASLINPYGVGLYSYFAQLANSPFMNAMITELKTISFNHAPNTLSFFLAAISGACFSWKDTRLSFTHKVLWILSLGAGLYSGKHIYLFTIFSLPMIGIALEQLLDYCRQFPKLKPVFVMEGSAFNAIQNKPLAWIGIWIVIAIIIHGAIKPSFTGVSEIKGVMAYLNKTGIRERILCNEMWGSYMLFYTQSRCVLDTRMDMYGDDYVRKYLSLYHMNTGWQKSQKPEDSWQEAYRQEMAKGLRYAIYPKSELAALVLQNVYHWTPLYQDKQVVLLEAPTISP